MIDIRHTAAVLLTAMAATAASAQTLRKEITVEHEVVPEQTDVTMLRFAPRFVMPQLPRPQLDYSDRSVFATVRPSITTLAPVAWGDSIATSLQNGYVALGIAPIYNLGVSAGYKFINNDRTRLNAWVQYNGTAYKGHYRDSQLNGQWQRSNIVTAAASLHHALSADRFLDFGVDYTFGRYSTPASVDSTGRQQMHRFNLSGMYTGSSSTLSYGVGAGVGFFSYSFSPDLEIPNTLPDGSVEMERMRPAHETKVSIQGGVSSKIGDTQRAGIAVEANLLSNSRHTHAEFLRSDSPDSPQGWYDMTQTGRHTHGLVTLAPYYKLSMAQVDFRAGVKAQVTVNSGKAIHIAPDVNLTWRPLSLLAVYGKAGGGEWQNTLTSLFDVTPYSLSSMAFKNSHVPVTVEGGVTFGPMRGVSVEVSWLYAAANDWLMPVVPEDGLTIFTPTKMRGYRFRGALGYRYGTKMELKLAYETAPQGPSRGYYLWRDRAKHLVSADLRVCPVKQLDVTVGWEYRQGRAQICPNTRESFSLGTISNLKVGALYRITDQWSAFVRGENLLCRRHLLIGGVPSQGINGLLGATYKF